jgi:hypothetical protein
MAGDASWAGIPEGHLSRNGAPLATAKLGYDKLYVYARVHVTEPMPIKNSADRVTLAFKGGDAVGLDLGPAGSRQAPGPGDIRILAANIGGRAHLVAMKPFSTSVKAPQDYYTPGGGKKHFDFVGDTPGARVELAPDPDGKGYTATFAAPRSLLDFPIAPGALIKGDVEVLLAGQGARGLQTTSRNYLYTPLKSQTSMVDDIPTESWLYPEYWGEIAVR